MARAYRAVPEYYDFEYSQQEMLRSDVPFFLERLPPGQSVLELAVGTGRCAIPIAQAGHKVVGTDHDTRMLAIAERKRDAVGMGDRELTLLGGDILTLDLQKRFDWVALFFNTFLVFTTLEQQDRALQTVRRHLKPRGRFWVDVFQPDPALLARPRSTGLEPTVFYVPELERTVVKTTEIRRDVAKQVQRVTFHYTWFDAKGRQRRERTTFDLTFVFPRELQLLMERNGMEIEKLYGNYDGSELKAESPRMIACCRLI